MEHKARENLEAAASLLSAEDPCSNAATSRAYYAAYQACWALLVAEDYHPPQMNRGTYFAHGEMADLAQRAGVLSHEESEELRFLESQRVIADYFSEGITLGVAQQCLTAAQSLVARLDEAS